MAIIDKAGAGVALAAVLLMAGGAHATSPANKCEAAKLKIAGKYTFCLMKQEANAVSTGGEIISSKCDTTFTTKWANAETKGGGMCPTAAPVTAWKALLKDQIHVVVEGLGGTRFVDNGDGTVSDTQTGFMWEKKTGTVGPFVNCSTTTCSDPHDINNRYA